MRRRGTGRTYKKQRPKKVTVEMVEEADLVILMGCPEKACPITPKKVVDREIEDPVGKV